MTDSTEIVGADTEGVIVVQHSQNEVEEWWDDTNIDEIEGYDLIKDAALFSLVGVPFKITAVIFRQGIQRKGIPWRDDYASCEIRVAPTKVIQAQLSRILTRRSGELIADKYAFAQPYELLVINDGSTGIYRQILEYLEAKELITLPDTFPADGEKGECRYDLPRSEWLTGAGEEGEDTEFKIALKAPRGLRYSEYKNDYTGDKTALTWYLA